METRWTSPGCFSTTQRSGTVTDPVAQTRPRSLRTRSTIITFSAWSFSSRSASVRPVPLIGPDSTVRPSRRQEELGGRGGDLHAVRGQPDRSCIGGGVAACQQRGEGVDVGGSRVRQRRGHHPAEVGLVDLARRDVLADAPYSGGVRGPVQGRDPVAGAGAAPGAGHGRGHRRGPYGAEAGADETALEIGAYGPEAGRVEGGGITGHVLQIGRDEAVEAGHWGEVVHVAESRTARGDLRRGERTAARCTNAFLYWPGNPLEFNTSPGHASGPETTSGRGSVGRASPCQGEGREFESRRPLEVGDLFPNPCTPGGVAERRGNGLQSRLHGFKSRLHLQGRLAQRESASLTRKRSLVQSQYRPLVRKDPRAISSAGERFPDTEEVTGSIPVSRTQYTQVHPARLAQRESASLTRKRSLVQSQYRAPAEAPVVSTTGASSFPQWLDRPGSAGEELGGLTDQFVQPVGERQGDPEPDHGSECSTTAGVHGSSSPLPRGSVDGRGVRARWRRSRRSAVRS